jgi:hypothetical protein
VSLGFYTNVFFSNKLSLVSQRCVLMDVLLVIDFPSSALNIVMKEIFESNMNRTFLKRFSINTIEVHSSEGMTCKLNGRA